MRIAIVGNAGSGKSTLARVIAATQGLPVLDLDTIFWERNQVAVRRKDALVQADLARFCKAYSGWVIEGCYGALIESVLAYAPTLIFLDPGAQVCARNCRARPWEPHKYNSRFNQDAQLDALLAWVASYYTRNDDMSHAWHSGLYAGYQGPKERRVQVRAVSGSIPGAA